MRVKKLINKSFKIDSELERMLNEVVSNINKKTNVEISKSDFIRISLKRILMLIKSGELDTATFLYNGNTK